MEERKVLKLDETVSLGLWPAVPAKTSREAEVEAVGDVGTGTVVMYS